MASLPGKMNFTSKLNANLNGKMRELVEISPTNGASAYSPNSYVDFEIPARQFYKMAQTKNAYYNFDINNKNVTHNVNLQGRAGSAGLVERQVISTVGATFSDVSGFNVLSPVLMSKNFDDDWLDHNGNGLMGTTSGINGIQIDKNNGTVDGTYNVSLPFLHCGASVDYFPLDCRHDYKIRLYLDTVVHALVANATGAVTDADITFTNFKFIYDVVELEPLVHKNYLEQIGNKYVIPAYDWQHLATSVGSGDVAKILQVGISRNKMQRLLLVFRENTIIETATAASTVARDKMKLTKILVKYKGKTVIASNGIEMTELSSSRAFAEVLKQRGSLLDTSVITLDQTSYDLDVSAGTSDATCGRFFYELDMTNHLASHSSESGMVAENNNITIELTKTAIAGDLTYTVDVFVQYYNEYHMNMNPQLPKYREWQVIENAEQE
jgi:hypothetical protein